MIASIAFRCSGVNSAASSGRAGAMARSAQARATLTMDGRMTAPGKIKSKYGSRFPSVVSLFRLPVDILRPIVGSRILRQQRLGPVGLLLRDFLLACRETLFGQRQGRHAHLIVPSLGGRQQAP